MFSVVIPSLHSPIIDTVVAALRAQTRPDLLHEIIVVGQDRFGRMPAGVTFVATPRPVAAGTARNLGARRASGHYVLFIDSDCLASADLLEQMTMHHQAGRPVVGGHVVSSNPSYWMQSDDMLVFADYRPGSTPGERIFVPSCCCSIKRDVFLAAGGFDERFPGAAGEEVDLCLRLRERGIPIYFEPATGVGHKHARANAAAVWHHLRRFGQVQVTLWKRHPEAMPAPLGGRLRPFTGLLTALAPLLATADVAACLARTSSTAAADWRFAPGMIWARTAWYWGIVEGLLAVPNGNSQP